MTDLRKAAEMALEVFEHLSKGESPAITQGELVYEIAALRQALNVDAVNMSEERVDEMAKREREWVGLTDEEAEILIKTAWNKEQTFNGLARAIEAKLREKNA